MFSDKQNINMIYSFNEVIPVVHESSFIHPLAAVTGNVIIGKNCYIGLGVYKANKNTAWRDKTQLPRQIVALRRTPNIQGMIFYSSKSLQNNLNGWSDSLRLNYFKEPVIPAAIPR